MQVPPKVDYRLTDHWRTLGPVLLSLREPEMQVQTTEVTMRAIGYQHSLSITDAGSLVDIEQPKPMPTGRDLLASVAAISVNPVDTKVRMRAQPEPGQWKVLGWDAAGTVEGIGPDVTRFQPGDAVFYAGAIGRPGTAAEFHLVDERIVGSKPKTLTMAEAAALPLTAITAWEMLFDRLDIRKAIPRRGERDPNHRRGRRGGLDRDPARAAADRFDCHRDRLAGRNAGLDPRPGRASCD